MRTIDTQGLRPSTFILHGAKDLYIPGAMHRPFASADYLGFRRAGLAGTCWPQGLTSLTCVAMYHLLPNASFTPALRSP